MKPIRLGALVVATTFAVLSPSVAMAGSYTIADPTGDVVKFDNSSDSTPTKVADRKEGDVRSSRVIHTKRRVTMAMYAAELSQVANGAEYVFLIGTKRTTRWLWIDTAPGHWGGTGSLEKNNGKRVKCRGIGWAIDYGTNAVRASVPMRCVGGARQKWVRVGMSLITFDGGDSQPRYYDEAMTNGHVGTHPAWGPKVFR